MGQHRAVWSRALSGELSLNFFRIEAVFLDLGPSGGGGVGSFQGIPPDDGPDKIMP